MFEVFGATVFLLGNIFGIFGLWDLIRTLLGYQRTFNDLPFFWTTLFALGGVLTLYMDYDLFRHYTQKRKGPDK